MSAGKLFDVAVATIFAREFLEGGIVIGEYRTIILRGDSLERGVRKDDALREVTIASICAAILALLIIAAIAIPLAILSHNFDDTTSNIIEGLSKIVASICLLQLSLKIPKFLGLYKSKKKSKRDNGDEASERLTLKSIKFNVAWNIWREVAECGVFLIPFFLSGDGLLGIPLSAVVGSLIGLLCSMGIYFANKRMKDKTMLAIFAVLVLVVLSAGLFSGGSHKLEVEIVETPVVWRLKGSFWSVNKLPMTILKPFGYDDTRTVLQIVCYWGWLLLAVVLHYRRKMYEKHRKSGSTSTLNNTETGLDVEEQGNVLELPQSMVVDAEEVTETLGDTTAQSSSAQSAYAPQDFCFTRVRE